ncbi:MAG: copper resistance system multicopper oxidase [Acidobacteria bacterium]|nr:copper resistance system multicopper oxidase [Acidobacteriota bacterium]
MFFTHTPQSAADVSRRRFVTGLAAGGVVLAAQQFAPSRVSAGIRATQARQPQQSLRGQAFDLEIGESSVDFTGRARTAITVNGSLPAPLLHWREGDVVTMRVRNTLREDASIHWHGLVLPANMDGVPGLSFDGIRAGGEYTYRFPVTQAGTYWYHSHSGFQEQRGLYGPIVIEPREPDPIRADREHVLMLTDWTDEDPARVYRKLKKESHYYNWRQRTVVDLVRDLRANGWSSTMADRLAWGGMRMNAGDLADVTGATYTYLLNGTTPAGNWTGLFAPGERVRLRVINGSAMTYFDLRIPGLKMTVVAADGMPVHPVTVDEFRIAVAETYDVIVEPTGQEAFTIVAQAMDRTGLAAGTLAVRDGLRAEVPELDRRPVLSMADMGHGHAASDADVSHDAHAGHGGHEGHGGAGAMMMAMQAHPASERRNPLVDMQTMMPAAKYDDPGIGLRDNGRRVLTYGDLRSAFADPDGREPTRTIELHLTGHMQRFAWSFNGRKFSEAEPITLTYGERVRIVLVNDTMMAHPIHLHGMWSDLEDEDGRFMVRKHTVDMPPGSRRSYRVTADALGRWAYHCHMLFHMETGMMREVHVVEGGQS